MELLSQQQIQQVSSAVAGLNTSQLAWVSGYLSGLSSQGSHFAAPSITTRPITTPSADRISVLYGSQTGNSKRIAEELHTGLSAQGIETSLHNLFDYRPLQLKKDSTLLIVISTQGNGEPPDEALSFFKYLESDRAPNLGHLEYAVLGLGDSSYDDFCETGIALDKQLTALGAQSFLARSDADIDFEETAALWQRNVINHLKENQTGSAETTTLVPETNTSNWTEATPYPAEIIHLIDLTTNESTQESYHIELAIEDYGKTYQAGDILALLPKNQSSLVTAIIQQAGLEAAEQVTLKSKEVTLFEALESKLEITKLTSKVVREYGEATNSSQLHNLVSNKEALRRFIQDADLLDLLNQYPEKLSAQTLVDLLRPLTSRQYSIASSAKAHEGEVHILVKPVSYQQNSREHLGAASNWLKQLQIGDTVPVHIKENNSFKLPKNPDDKIIMIGAGTGVAPYRSFLFEREAQGAKGNSWLFFGEQHFRSDFLYQTDWQSFLKKGVLERMSVAFSRDQEEKVYVQHKIAEEAETLYQWLKEGAYLYVCGDINRMAADVHQALLDVIVKQSTKSRQDAEDYLKELQLEKRYQRDVY